MPFPPRPSRPAGAVLALAGSVLALTVLGGAAVPASAQAPGAHARAAAPGNGGGSPVPELPATDPGGAPARALPASVVTGRSTQLITVSALGTYATVTAWEKEDGTWRPAFSTGGGRVGENGVVDGAARKQGTSTTPSGTYTLTEGFGLEPGRTAMPYTRVDDRHWWVQDTRSKYYNQMRTPEEMDYPLTTQGPHSSEHLVDYPVQYAKTLVVDFNRWPAVPGRGAGIFLHVNGRSATGGCVSVPYRTMDRILRWITPSAHPLISIGWQPGPR
ncbi:L,D-transpeptidase family protein [Streptomyces albus]|uniref:L,D-transpeptidase family protein n=1 Tax=Streptomyces albus TaxID=1888 RepID=UPI00099CCEFE|nr:L,D-transpeptidase family protein [Streptomyces albus]